VSKRLVWQVIFAPCESIETTALNIVVVGAVAVLVLAFTIDHHNRPLVGSYTQCV